MKRLARVIVSFQLIEDLLKIDPKNKILRAGMDEDDVMSGTISLIIEGPKLPRCEEAAIPNTVPIDGVR